VRSPTARPLKFTRQSLQSKIKWLDVWEALKTQDPRILNVSQNLTHSFIEVKNKKLKLKKSKRDEQRLKLFLSELFLLLGTNDKSGKRNMLTMMYHRMNSPAR
jgi:hypothetical protein